MDLEKISGAVCVSGGFEFMTTISGISNSCRVNTLATEESARADRYLKSLLSVK